MDANKNFYKNYHDQIFDKRINSEFRVRRMVHHDMYAGILENVSPTRFILDVGCGEGALSIMLSDRAEKIIAIDYSKKNVKQTKNRIAKEKISNIIVYSGDAENLLFPANSFDMVISNHVLEHLPNFQRGLNEIYRVTNKYAIIAVPTCFNLCSFCLLGGGSYYQFFSKKTIYAIFYGALRVIYALIKFEDGVDEGYGEHMKQIHIFRFPWAVKRDVIKSGFTIKKIQAQSIRIPYLGLSFNFLRKFPLFKYLGMGTVYILEKKV
jgi:ubiquinone/menaquinone biosynthesis C-methylase UbiE